MGRLLVITKTTIITARISSLSGRTEISTGCHRQTAKLVIGMILHDELCWLLCKKKQKKKCVIVAEVGMLQLVQGTYRRSDFGTQKTSQ